MKNPESMPNEEVHDLGSVLGNQVEIFAEIARLEGELEDPTLKPEEIKAKKEELKTYRDAYKNLK